MRFAKLAVIAVVMLAGPRPARAGDPNADAKRALERCGADSEAAQRHRKAGRLLAARDSFRRCARAECPAPISSFCLSRLNETEAALPTLVVRARDANGTDVPDLDVFVNGARVGRSDGRAISVEPGPNAVRAFRGTTPVSDTTSLVVLEGEKLRAVSLTIGPRIAASPEPARPEPAAPSRSVGPLPWVLGGLGLASLGTGAALWTSGLVERSNQLDAGGCAPRCDDSVTDSIRTRLVIGDVLVAVGVVSIGVATYLFLRPTPRASAVTSRAGTKLHDPVGVYVRAH